MVKVLVDPVHEVPPKVNIGVTIILAVMGAVAELLAVKDILPVPLETKPMEVLSFVQE